MESPGRSTSSSTHIVALIPSPTISTLYRVRISNGHVTRLSVVPKLAPLPDLCIQDIPQYERPVCDDASRPVTGVRPEVPALTRDTLKTSSATMR